MNVLIGILIICSSNYGILQEKTDDKLKKEYDEITKALSDSDEKVREKAKTALVNFIDSDAKITFIQKQTQALSREIEEAIKNAIRGYRIKTHGLIAFIKNSHIWIMNGDGTDQEKLTQVEGNNSYPVFSPDGKKLVYTSDDIDKTTKQWIGTQIYVYDLETKSEKRITTECFNHSVSFSQDSKMILYGHTHWNYWTRMWEGHVMTIDTDGKNIKQLTEGNAIHGTPSFSSDGKKIVFSANRDYPWLNHITNIYTMDSDGKNLKQLTFDTGYNHTYPSFTNGGKIVFHTYGYSGKKTYIMDSDGKNGKAIETDELYKLFSPDGKRIVLTEHNSITKKDEIHIYDIETKKTMVLTEGSRAAWFPPVQKVTETK